MSESTVTLDNELFARAAGRHRHVAETQFGQTNSVAQLRRDVDEPAVSIRTERENAAPTGGNQGVTNAHAAQLSPHPVERVALPDASKIELDARSCESHGPRLIVELDEVHADGPAGRLDGLLGRHVGSTL